MGEGSTGDLIEIRPAEARDFDALVALSVAYWRSRQSWTGTYWSPPAIVAERRLWSGRLRDRRGWIGVTEAGPTRVGSITVWPSGRRGSDPRLAYLAGPLVDPDWWGEGIGSALYDEALSVLASRGFRRAEMAVEAGNRRGREFLEHRGWALAEAGRARSPMALLLYTREVDGKAAA